MRVIGPVFLIALCLPVFSSAGARTLFGLPRREVDLPTFRCQSPGQLKPGLESRSRLCKPKPRQLQSHRRLRIASLLYLQVSRRSGRCRRIADGNGCEAPDVVQLDAVLTGDHRRVSLSPPALLRCNMATAIAKWVREDLQTLATSQGGALSGLDNFNSFECRGRNRLLA